MRAPSGVVALQGFAPERRMAAMGATLHGRRRYASYPVFQRSATTRGGASLKERAGAPPTQPLASSTKVRDDVSGFMLGAYVLARHAARCEGTVCVCR